MRRFSAPLLLFLLAACAQPRAHPRPPADGWSVGYWCWKQTRGWAAASAESRPDVLYVQTGRIGADAVLETRWPEAVPQAVSYLAVWRADLPAPPAPALVGEILESYRRVKTRAASVGQRVVGLQIDDDCPTPSLAAYARFLAALRQGLPAEDVLSITALLDWFAPGTGVTAVVSAVDEHVPQFYDVAPARATPRIAAAIDPARWAPVFEALGRPYRVGIASFGRIERVRGGERAAFRDLTPLEVATGGLAFLGTETSDAGERVVRYEAQGATALSQLLPGDRLELILPGEGSVRAAWEAARRFGGRCAGVVFFRWPEEGEALALTPDEVHEIVSTGSLRAQPPRLAEQDGGCSRRRCVDLFVRPPRRFAEEPLGLRLRASSDVEYLVPAARRLLAQTGPRLLEARIPAYAGAGLVRLGRVFTRADARYEILP